MKAFSPAYEYQFDPKVGCFPIEFWARPLRVELDLGSAHDWVISSGELMVEHVERWVLLNV